MTTCTGTGYALLMRTEVLTGMSVTVLVAGLLIAAIAVVLIMLAYGAGRRHGFLEAERSQEDRIEDARRDAVERSRAALSGQLSEQLAPWLPDFPVNPAEARFIGKPVDFVAFCGAEEGTVREIVFIEVKKGRSSLSSVERSIRDAIVDGRVRWIEYRIE